MIDLEVLLLSKTITEVYWTLVLLWAVLEFGIAFRSGANIDRHIGLSLLDLVLLVGCYGNLRMKGVGGTVDLPRASSSVSLTLIEVSLGCFNFVVLLEATNEAGS
jgi:hypothetical protein